MTALSFDIRLDILKPGVLIPKQGDYLCITCVSFQIHLRFRSTVGGWSQRRFKEPMKSLWLYAFVGDQENIKKKKRHLPLGHVKSILVMCLGRNVEDTLTLVKFISIFSPWLSIQLQLLFLGLSLLKSCHPFFQLCYSYSKPAPFFCTPVYAWFPL